MPFRNNSNPSHDVGPQADRPLAPSEDGLLYASEVEIAVWDSQAGVWRTSGGGGGGSSGMTTLVYTNGAADEANNIFNDWTRLYAKWIALPTEQPKRIAIDSTDDTSLHVPSGIWTIGRTGSIASARAPGQNGQLTLDDGAVLNDLYEIGNGVAVIGNSFTPSLTWSPPLNPGDPTVMVIGLASDLVNIGNSPMVQWDKNIAVTNLFFGLTVGSGIFAFGPAPVVNVTPAAAFTSQVAFVSYDGSTIGDGVLSGSDGPGTAVVLFSPTDGQVSLNQPGWTAAASLSDFTAFQSNGRPRVNIHAPPVLSGLYFVNNGSEFVRVAPNGANAVSIVLPDPKLCPDETVLIKKTNNDTAMPVTISSAGGGTVDGAPTDVWPAVGFYSRKYTSDGLAWYGTGIDDVATTAPYVSRVWYVDATANPAVANGSPIRQFATIGAALAVASKGDEISLAPGTYVEDLAIVDAMSIVTDGEAVIDGTLTLSAISDEIMLDGITITTGNIIMDSGPTTAVLKLIRTSVVTTLKRPALDYRSPGWSVTAKDSTLNATFKSPGVYLEANNSTLTLEDSEVIAVTSGLNPSILSDHTTPIVNCLRSKLTGRVQSSEGSSTYDNCEIVVDSAEPSYFVGTGLATFNLINGTRVSGLSFGNNNICSGGGTVHTDGIITLDNNPVSLLPPAISRNTIYNAPIHSNSAPFDASSGNPINLTKSLEDLIIVFGALAPFVVVLPPADGVLIGRRITIKNYHTVFLMTINVSPGDTIDGQPSTSADPANGFTAITLQLRNNFGVFDWVVCSP